MADFPKIEMSTLSTPQLRRLLETSRDAGRQGVADQVAKELERRSRVAHTLVSSSFDPGSMTLERGQDDAPEAAAPERRRRPMVAGIGVALVLGLVAAPAWFVYEHGLPRFEDPQPPPTSANPRANVALLPPPSSPVAAPTQTPAALPQPQPPPSSAGRAPAAPVNITRAQRLDDGRVDLSDSPSAAASAPRPAVRCDKQGSPAQRAVCDDAEQMAAEPRTATTLSSDTLSVGQAPSVRKP